MSTPASSPDWVTTFDWQRAGPDAGSGATLSRRLLAALQAREGLRDELADSEEAASFGRYIAVLRRTRGWSRPRLAEQAGVDPLAIALLEEAALTLQELSPGLVARLAHAFGLSVQQLAINPAPQRQAVEAQPDFGRWLRGRLAGLLTGPALAPSPAWRGGPAPGRTTDLAGLPTVRGDAAGAMPEEGTALSAGSLGEVLALPEQTLVREDGTALQALPTLEPADPPLAGLAVLRVRLLDAQGAPVAGRSVELEMGGLPFVSPEPTDARGTTLIPDLPLEMLGSLERLDLRLS